MSATKVITLSLAVLFLCTVMFSHHQVEAGKLEKLAALALILKAQRGGGGGHHHKVIPIPIHHKPKKKKHEFKIKFEIDHKFDKKELEKLGDQLSSGHYKSPHHHHDFW